MVLRVFGRIVAAVALVLVFVTAAVVGVLLHLDLPPARKLVACAGMQALAPLLMGRVEIVSAVDNLDRIPIADLADLLAAVSPVANATNTAAVPATSALCRAANFCS